MRMAIGVAFSAFILIYLVCRLIETKLTVDKELRFLVALYDVVRGRNSLEQVSVWSRYLEIRRVVWNEQIADSTCDSLNAFGVYTITAEEEKDRSGS